MLSKYINVHKLHLQNIILNFAIDYTPIIGLGVSLVSVRKAVLLLSRSGIPFILRHCVFWSR